MTDLGSKARKRTPAGARSRGRGASATAAPAEARSRGRGDRRKRETRARLLEAALVLMAERGMAGVAINEITEAADVGFGSFYNHFESKEAIHAAVVDEVLERFGGALSRIAETLEDPAEILSASIRYVALRAREQPVWGRFLLRSAFSLQNLSRGMGPYLLRDLERGIAAGRFASEDLLITVLEVGGAAAGAVATEVELASRTSETRAVARQLGLEMQSIPERTAAAVLRVLGLPAAESDEIARRPLPAVELPAGFV
jgi:AcrR family transcriptional regulator